MKFNLDYETYMALICSMSMAHGYLDAHGSVASKDIARGLQTALNQLQALQLIEEPA